MVLDQFFFFSSRRRHTRFDCDWSSDVCSSDLLFIAMRKGITKCNKSLLLISIPMIVQLGGIFLFSIAGEYRYILPFFTITLVFLPILQMRSEEHTSELQSQSNLVCRLLLEKKK